MDKSEAARGVPGISGAHSPRVERIDAAPLTTIAAVHGVTFGGGFELALACDLIIADKMARFCFPELRLGLIPGYRRNPAPEAGFGQCRRTRPAADRPQFQRHQGAADRAGEPGGIGRAKRCARPGPQRRRSGKFDREPRWLLPNDSSSRFRRTSCGRKSIFFASCFRGRRCKPD